MLLSLILLVFSFVCFVLAAVPREPLAPYWNRLVPAGLAFLVASLLFTHAAPLLK
jgi:hypothetical protein